MDLRGRIENLNRRKEELEREYDGSMFEVTGNESGYFTRETDGFEDVLTLENLDEMSINDLKYYISKEYVLNTDHIGKIIHSYNWCYVIVVSEQEAKRFTIGSKLKGSFNDLNINNIDFQVKDIRTDDEEKDYVVVLSSKELHAELLRSRTPKLELVFSNYFGLRVSPSAIRYEGKDMGVYVVENDTIRFKRITPVYTTDSYVLCAVMNSDSYLRQYQQVVVKGTDLYDGKSILRS
jgi:putative membrane fusion protein